MACMGAAVTNPWCTPIEKHLPTPPVGGTCKLSNPEIFEMSEGAQIAGGYISA